MTHTEQRSFGSSLDAEDPGMHKGHMTKCEILFFRDVHTF